MSATDQFLTSEMIALIRNHPLGFVATTNADGTPNLSPKGTFVVLDGSSLAFADIRSPNTFANVRERPVVEINFSDPFSRRCVRVRGMARILDVSDPRYSSVKDSVAAAWQALADHMKAIIRVEVSDAGLVASPSYDVGATEQDLRAYWTARFRAQQPGGRFVGE